MKFMAKHTRIESKQYSMLFPNLCNAFGCCKKTELHAVGVITIKGDFIHNTIGEGIHMAVKIPLCLSHANDMRIADEWEAEN